MTDPRETIAAIATPAGEGAIGVVRISGPRALHVAHALAGVPLDAASHRVHVRTLRHDGDVLDEAVVLTFRGPRSFTGEDVVELQCHGGSITLRRVLDAVLAQPGVHAAEPGAFSRQALLNGRLDLVQVEAIADIIHARSVAAQRLAQQHLAGRLSRDLAVIRERLFRVVTLVEAAIDFALEEDVYSISPAEIAAELAPALDGLRTLLATWDAGRLRHEGVRVAIVGRPNAGKSSLLNHLLGEDRALVTEIEGTTRDYLEEACELAGVRFVLVDTAGIRVTDDRVEALGVERARALAARADVVLLVADARDPAAAAALARELHVAVGGVLWNKRDLVPAAAAVDGGAATALPSLPDPLSLPPTWRDAPQAHVSLLTGEAVELIPELLTQLADRAGYRHTEETVLLSRARHRDTVAAAVASLERAIGAADAGMDHTFVALDLRAGLQSVASLTGAVTDDDILNAIFSDFCIGK